MILGMLSLTHAQTQDNFEVRLDTTVDTSEINQLPENLNTILEPRNTERGGWGLGNGENIRDFIVDIAVNIIIPIMTFVGIIVSILGFYSLMISDSEEETNKAWKYIVFGVIGIIIMISAWYITETLFGVSGTWASWVLDFSNFSTQLDGAPLAGQIYAGIIYPFLKIFMFVVIGVLFILVMINAFKYLFSGEEGIEKKALSILIYSVIGIFVILLAKEIVEFIYGSFDTVIDSVWESEGLIDVGEPLFSGGLDVAANFEMLRSIINRVLGAATFIVLLIILYLWYMLLLQPTNEDAIKNIKNYIIYLLIWIFVIGASYIIMRLLLITI